MTTQDSDTRTVSRATLALALEEATVVGTEDEAVKWADTIFAVLPAPQDSIAQPDWDTLRRETMTTLLRASGSQEDPA